MPISLMSESGTFFLLPLIDFNIDGIVNVLDVIGLLKIILKNE